MKAVLVGVLACLFLIGSVEAADKVRIAVTNYNITYLTAVIASKKGFFRDEGLDP